MHRTIVRPLAALASCLAIWAALPATAAAGGDWNDKEVAWRPLAPGLEEAAEAKRPLLLIVYTDWCPHCTTYSALFHRDDVVAASKNFVMVRVNKDDSPGISRRYAPDGEYVPRTYFLDPSGQLDEAIHENRSKFRYFFNTSDATSLLRAMNVAQGKFGAD